MTGRRWQSYTTPKMPKRFHERADELREREAERQADAAYRLYLRDKQAVR